MGPPPAAEGVWVSAGFAAYAAATALACVRGPARDLARAFMPALLAIGVTILGWTIGARWQAVGHGPFMTLYEVLLSNLFSVGAVSAVGYAYSARLRAGSVVTLPLLLMMGSWTIMLSPQPVPLPPTFENPWLWVHVLAGKLFLGVLMLAVGLCGVLLFERVRRRQPAADGVGGQDRVVWQLAAIAFVLDSFMLVAGAVWAHDAWGRYWAWDPLETWAFLTWLALGIVLHVRITLRLPVWSLWSLLIGVFVLAFLTFFGVPFFSLAPHKGVM
jgi:ABC-type transport system involved in cytochrome c biogenesis permease subunit